MNSFFIGEPGSGAGVDVSICFRATGKVTGESPGNETRRLSGEVTGVPSVFGFHRICRVMVHGDLM